MEIIFLGIIYGLSLVEATELPPDSVLTVAIEDNEIPFLYSELVQNQIVLSHPAVKQLQPLSRLEHDPELDMSITPQPTQIIESDPNVAQSNHHLLLPLAQRAAFYEGLTPVSTRLLIIHVFIISVGFGTFFC